MGQLVTKQQRAATRPSTVKARPAGAKAAQRRKRAASKPTPGAERRVGQAGRRLAEAFEAVSSMPALAEARRRLLRACEHDGSSPAELAEAIESDAGLAIAVMRAANNGNGPRARAGGVREALDSLTPMALREVGASVETYDPFESPTALAERHERFRRHALATRHAADRIAELARLPDRDELAVAALLHDVGRPVLAELYGDFKLDDLDVTPDERVRRERRELGIDHALVGAVMVRRWALPPSVCDAIEGHHSPEAHGHAAAIRLADLIVHYADGDPVPPQALVGAASRLGLDRKHLGPLLYEFPHSGIPRRRASDPCPLSDREIDALRGLAEGKVYKQIARELSLSVSTIRTHLHNVYRKIGAVDRAQAVLIARDKGWI